MDENKVDNFVKKMQWVAGIPDGYSRADETAVLIGEAKKFPAEALAACKRAGTGIASSVERAVLEHLEKTGQPVPDVGDSQSAPRKKSNPFTPTQTEVVGDYDEARVNNYINQLSSMTSSGSDHENARMFRQFIDEAKRHPADALETAMRLQPNRNKSGYFGLFINEITSRFKKAEVKPDVEPEPEAPLSQNILQQPLPPPIKMPEIPPVDMNMFKSLKPVVNEKPEKPALNADTGAMAHIENLSKPSRSKVYKEAFATLKSMGDDAIDTIVIASENKDYAEFAQDLMQLLGEINTPKSLETLQTLRREGSTSVQTAAIRVLSSLGKL